MTRWIVAFVLGMLVLCEMIFSVPGVFAQAPGGPFEQLSPGNQKGARALFEAQKPDLPQGTKPLTLDEIAARRHNGEGWIRVFDAMKSQGLVEEKNFGHVVSNYDHRRQVSAGGRDK